jgi:hypothetical protein
MDKDLMKRLWGKMGVEVHDDGTITCNSTLGEWGGVSGGKWHIGVDPADEEGDKSGWTVTMRPEDYKPPYTTGTGVWPEVPKPVDTLIDEPEAMGGKTPEEIIEAIKKLAPVDTATPKSKKAKKSNPELIEDNEDGEVESVSELDTTELVVAGKRLHELKDEELERVLWDGTYTVKERQQVLDEVRLRAMKAGMEMAMVILRRPKPE